MGWLFREVIVLWGDWDGWSDWAIYWKVPVCPRKPMYLKCDVDDNDDEMMHFSDDQIL